MNEPFYKNVLLVDDDPVQIAILGSYFAGLGTPQVQSATNSRIALELLDSSKQPVDLIVSDLQMPEMDGLEFLRHLNDRNYRGALAIMSGVKGDLLVHAAKLANLQGLNLIGHLGKPVSKQGLDNIFLSGRKPDVPAPPAPQEEEPVLDEAVFRRALADRRFKLFYQPKVDTRTRQVCGAEALARWIGEDGSFAFPPAQFIEYAENNDLIEELTFQLFDIFLQDVQQFRAANRKLHYAFNLAASLLQNTSLPDRICAMMNEYHLPAAMVGFEVTETATLNLDAATLEVLSRLRIYDFEISIDDFGTGHANIRNLKDFPYSELKIDSSFVLNAVKDSFSRRTVTSAVDLARELAIPVVAEGIEDRETWDFVCSLGIEKVQGYFLAKPMPPEAFVRFASDHSEGLVLAA
ncbi:EAL domain-containing response regulator [Salaquimonas pukyongi]|uniref:EAL domain-containing response regulator n=1 Tax=Salaquimonas pukyongi TaxID=2712698 RepID=UPI00096BC215|nr:EAL domain-containing response regulator [Salaquimonas pukyongi]